MNKMLWGTALISCCYIGGLTVPAYAAAKHGVAGLVGIFLPFEVLYSTFYQRQKHCPTNGVVRESTSTRKPIFGNNPASSCLNIPFFCTYSIAPGYIETDVSFLSLLISSSIASHWSNQMNTKLLQDPTRLRQITERIPAGRWGQPKDFEGVVVFLASKASDYVCGETIVVDGGWMGR